MTIEELLQPYYYPSSGKVDYQGAKKAMQEYARIKCLETARNVRHKACDIIIERLGNRNMSVDMNACTRDIQNIRNEDVIPEL